MPVLTGSVHAHIPTKPSRAGFAVIRLEVIEAGAATCDERIKRRHSFLPISLSGNLKMVWVLIRLPYDSLFYFSISHHVRNMEWRLCRVVSAAAVTTHAKPHAQQQLARDLDVERAAVGQRCRPQSFGELQRGNP